MDNLYIINPESITYFLGTIIRKSDNKPIHYIGIRVGEVERVLCWLSDNDYNKLIPQN